MNNDITDPMLSRVMAQLARKRWAKSTSDERKKIIQKMVDARMKKRNKLGINSIDRTLEQE